MHAEFDPVKIEKSAIDSTVNGGILAVYRCSHRRYKAGIYCKIYIGKSGIYTNFLALG